MGNIQKPEFWYDFETTGLDIATGAAVVQFSYQIVENGVVKFEGNEFINPFSYPRNVTISPEALKVNGRKESEFETFRNLEEVFLELLTLLTRNYPKSKLTLIGYNNSTFDKYFIEEWFTLFDKPFWKYFNWKQIDVFEVVKFMQHIGFMGSTYNQKLATIAEHLKVVGEDYNWHDSLNDVRATRLIHEKIQGALIGESKK